MSNDFSRRQSVPIAAPAFALAVATLLASGPHANAATTLMIAREGFDTVAEISGVTTNSNGGFVTRINYNSTGTAGTASYFGNAVRGTGTNLRTEGTVGGFVQTNLSASMSFNNAAQIAYTAPNGTTSGLFLDSSLLAATNGTVNAGPLAGKIYQDVGPAFVSTAGSVSYLATLKDTAGGKISSTAIFSGTAGSVLLKVGDTVTGAGNGTQNSGNVIVAPTTAADNANVVLDEVGIGGVNFSARATHYVATANVGRDYRVTTSTPASTFAPVDDTVLVKDGAAATTPSGGIIRTDELIPVADGGRANERLRSILNPKVNDAGDVIFATSGRIGTDSSTEQDLVVFNGKVVARENTDYFGVALGSTGINPSVDVNENGDYAFTFANQIFVDQSLAIKAGDLIDTDGDGVNDTALGSVAPQGFALGDRLADGTVDVYFTGRMGTTADYLFRVNVTVPEPASLSLIGLAGAALLRRRRAQI